jgi:hypothetical protein
VNLMSDEREELKKRQNKERQDREAAHARQQASQGGVAPSPDKPPSSEGDTEEAVLKDDEKEKKKKPEGETPGESTFVGAQMAGLNKSKARKDAEREKEQKEAEKAAAAEAQEKKDQDEREKKAAVVAEEEKKKSEEAAAAAVEAERRQQAEIQALQAQLDKEKEKNVEYNQELGQHQLEEEKAKDLKEKQAQEANSNDNREGPFDKMQDRLNEGAEKIAELKREVAFEKSRAEHIALREEVNEDTGKTFFEEHQEKAKDKGKGFLKDIAAGNQEGESPLEAMRRRKKEKLAAAKDKQGVSEQQEQKPGPDSPGKATVNPDEQAIAEHYEKHANVMGELKGISPVRDDANRELEEAFGATTVGVDQTAKTNRVADTPEEVKEQGLSNSKAVKSPVAKLVASREMKAYEEEQREAKQDKQDTSAPTPGHSTAPNPNKKT